MKIPSPEIHIKSHNGITVFLDILGYQNFIDKNEVSKAVQILDNVFHKLKDNVQAEFATNWIGGKIDKFLFEELEILTLSDSIIIHLPEEKGDPIHRFYSWATILAAVRVLQRRLFEQGFPSRGAIDCGEYYCDQGFLVGKPFMEAYRLSQSLDLSGTAMTAAAKDSFASSLGTRKIEDIPAFNDYLTPLKGGQEKNLYMISMLRNKEIEEIMKKDISQWVHEIFWMHKKDAGRDVDTKIANTIKFLRFCISKQIKYGQTPHGQLKPTSKNLKNISES